MILVRSIRSKPPAFGKSCGRSFRRWALLCVLAVLVASLKTADISAQAIAVAPQMIVVNADSKATSITLVNTGSRTAEISLSAIYGYPVTDSAGNLNLRMPDRIEKTEPSIVENTQIYPQKLKLAPGERQVVRILINAPGSIPDREYWGRLLISSRGARVAVEGLDDNKGVNVGLDLEIRTLLPIYYRKGITRTGVEIGKVSSSRLGDSLVVRLELNPTTKAAFVGTVKATLKDPKGRRVQSANLPLSLLHGINPRLAVPVHGLPPGDYILSLETADTRADINPKLLLRAPTAKRDVSVRI